MQLVELLSCAVTSVSFAFEGMTHCICKHICEMCLLPPSYTYMWGDPKNSFGGGRDCSWQLCLHINVRGVAVVCPVYEGACS